MRTRRLGSLACLLALTALTALGAGSPKGAEPLSSLRLLPPVLLEGEAGWPLAERMRFYKVEGVSVAVIRDFRVAWEAAAGVGDREAGQAATIDTLFQAGSISKPVAAAGILREVEKGTFRLEADVNEYLKSWKVPENTFTARQKVTLERLLNHGAGLTVHGFPGYEAGAPVPTLPQILDGAPPANTAAVRVDMEPGTKWRYSGGGYTIAQLALVDTVGKPFPQILKELVLGPAGMTRSTYEQPLPPPKLRLAAAGYYRDGSAVAGKRHTYPEMAAAGLWTTAGDLARFGLAIAKSRRGDSGSLLRQATARRMTTVVLDSYGLGFTVEDRGADGYFSHDGADEGFQAFLIVHRDRGYGAAVMANSENGVRLALEIVRGIAKQDGWGGYLPLPLALKPLPPAESAALVGRYQLNGDEAFSVALKDGRLFGQDAEGGEYELFAIGDRVLVRKDRGTRYRIAAGGIDVENGAERIAGRKMADGATIPSDALTAGRIAAAQAEYRALFAAKPADAGVAEPRLNQLGYALAGRGEYPKAIAVMKLMVEFYPSSANALDSLCEVELKSGDRAAALASARRVLEVLPRDTKLAPELRAVLRKNAEDRIQELSR